MHQGLFGNFFDILGVEHVHFSRTDFLLQMFRDRLFYFIRNMLVGIVYTYDISVRILYNSQIWMWASNAHCD